MGPASRFRSLKKYREVRAVKVAEAAFGTVLHSNDMRQTVSFRIHLVGEFINLLGAAFDTKPAALAKVFEDGNVHGDRSDQSNFYIVYILLENFVNIFNTLYKTFLLP